jgi:hypothetical protein
MRHPLATIAGTLRDVRSCPNVALPNAASAGLLCNAYAEEGTSHPLRYPCYAQSLPDIPSFVLTISKKV